MPSFLTEAAASMVATLTPGARDLPAFKNIIFVVCITAV